ncbi:MAG TPA: hypothetical protein VG122_11475 [Gemmata sp.]|nr:hypothetical protein [Gemmata sp.]
MELTNTDTEGHDARVVVFYDNRPDVHYARDVFVPGRSTVSSWVTLGPAPEQQGQIHREIEILLYDRTGGQERLIRPPGTERVLSHPLFYRRRKPTIALLPPQAKADTASESERLESIEPLELARVFSEAAGMSESISVIEERFLPPVPEAFDGIDLLVLASDHFAVDPVSLQCLRRWVEQGGTLWVLLDRVNLAGISPLLGDEFDLQVIDRVGLTTVRLHAASSEVAEQPQVDRPVDLVRVTLGPTDTVIHRANGWPASFTRTVGRGRILFTTLGARGWYRPRTAHEPRSRFEHFPDQPVSLNPLAELAVRFQPHENPQGLPTDALRDMLMQEVGYSVVTRRTAATIFGVFLLALLGLGIGLRRSRRPELLGWLAPAAAVGAAAVFLGLGEASRSAAPPTIGIAEIVDAFPGSREAAAAGVFAVYRPNSGPVPLMTDQGGMLDFDHSGFEGQNRQRIMTDQDAWHWENLNLPAGIRTGSFRSTIRATRLSAVARFGPNGLDGWLTTEPFHGPTDGLIITAGGQALPIRSGDGDTFTARSEDALPSGQYLSAAVLTDRQQRRQGVYRQLLGESLPKHWQGRNLLLTWVDRSELPFRVESGDRVVATTLLAIPLEFTSLPADTPVTIPQAFIPYSRMLMGRPRSPPLDGSMGIEMELRFQLPLSVLPLTIERVQLSAKVRTPGRRFTVSGHGEKGLVQVFNAESPLDPIQININDPQLLHIDPDGGLRLTVTIGEENQSPVPAKTSPPVKGSPGKKGPLGGKEPPGGKESANTEKVAIQSTDLLWKIESLGLEVVGRTAVKR